MRIAVITNAYPPNAQGGAGEVAASLVELWKELDHDVRVWQPKNDWLKKNPLRRLFGHLFDDRGSFADLEEALSWNPELVVTHNLTGIGWGTGRAFQKKGIRWIHVLHDVQLFEPSGQLRNDVVTSWQRFWSWYRCPLFGTPDLAVSPTRWLLEAHARRGFAFGKKEVIPNPAPSTVFEEGGAKRTDAWLFVGRLSEDKGADLFLEVAKARPDESFVCVGDGPLRASLDAQKNVYCLGHLPRTDVQTWMRSSFALLMPSRLQENQPTVIIEACVNGLPMIASKNGGIPETLGEAGIIAELTLSDWLVACDQMKFESADWMVRAKERAGYFEREKIRGIWKRML